MAEALSNDKICVGRTDVNRSKSGIVTSERYSISLPVMMYSNLSHSAATVRKYN